MNVVSTSLFTDHARYQPYLSAALRAHHNLFRGWTYRIYHDHLVYDGPYGEALRRLEARGLVEMCFVSDDAAIERAMLWRVFLPLWDLRVERFIVRDIDMVASFRERRAVEEWIRSGLPAHSMSDRRGHHDWPAINGMLGFTPEVRELLDAGSGRTADTLEKLFARAGWPESVWRSNYRASGPGADPKNRVCASTTNNQFFLGIHVWPFVQKHALEHRLSGCPTFGAAQSRQGVADFPGEDLGVSAAIREQSDALIPFIGASRANSDIDLDRIVEFYREHGDADIERAISECEAGA